MRAHRCHHRRLIVITVTPEEAETLRTIVGSITGDIHRGPRFQTDTLYDALGNLGIVGGLRCTGTIGFPDRHIPPAGDPTS